MLINPLSESPDLAEVKDPLLAYLDQQVTGYARSPSQGAAVEIVRCLEMLATSLGVSSPLLCEVGQQLSNVRQKNVFDAPAAGQAERQAPAACYLMGLAESEHCSVTRCADRDMIYVQLSLFNVRFPVAVFRSICKTFMDAESRLEYRTAKAFPRSRALSGCMETGAANRSSFDN